MDHTLLYRRARLSDLQQLNAVMEASVRGLFARDHNPKQTWAALEYLFRIDPYLIEDGTYDVCERAGRIFAGGGWSRRKNPYGKRIVEVAHAPRGNGSEGRTAVVRGMFVHPTVARRGIGRELLRRAESAARVEGFRRFELLSTLTGEALYLRAGFRRDGAECIELPNGVAIMALRMSKSIARDAVNSAA